MIKTFAERFVRMLPYWLCAFLGLGRRYGVRYASGTQESLGFLFASHARTWAQSEGLVEDTGAVRLSRGRTGRIGYVVFQYEPIDLRILPEVAATRAHWSGT